MFALIDCNNFYASCERLFQPHLRNEPIVILSNNDGCVIARSNEAKALGIAMGVPYFQVQALCKQHKVQVFSSNFSFYGDMSRRVMAVIEASWPEVEIYSIDEAFLALKSLPLGKQDSFCQQLQEKIVRHTGIPVSIGLGPTKTLAKLANHVAKKMLKIPVFNITEQRHWLEQIAIGDVWGIGRKWQKKLMQQGIYLASDLAKIPPRLVKHHFNVALQRTALELQGLCCNGVQVAEVRQSILSSRTFGSQQTDYDFVAQALSSHCARAYAKLREQGLQVNYVAIFIRTNPFRSDLPQYAPSMGVKLAQPTDDLRELTRAVKWCLEKIYRPGYSYHKVGVHFSDLMTQQGQQHDLFSQQTAEQQAKTERFLKVFDAINRKYGKQTIRLAAEGNVKPWATRSTMRSPCYTTCWADLPLVRA